MNRDTFINSLHAGKAEIETLWGGLSIDQMTRRPGVQSDWSVKDLIAHLTHWQRTGLENVQRWVNSHTPPTRENTDTVNARVFAANKDRALDDIRADFERSTHDIIEWLETQPADVLAQPGWNSRTLADYLATETFEHYLQHIDDLRGFVTSVKHDGDG